MTWKQAIPDIPTTEFDDHRSIRNPFRDLGSRILQEANLIICEIVLI